MNEQIEKIIGPFITLTIHFMYIMQWILKNWKTKMYTSFSYLISQELIGFRIIHTHTYEKTQALL